MMLTVDQKHAVNSAYGAIPLFELSHKVSRCHKLSSPLELCLLFCLEHNFILTSYEYNSRKNIVMATLSKKMYCDFESPDELTHVSFAINLSDLKSACPSQSYTDYYVYLVNDMITTSVNLPEPYVGGYLT
ncbi:TPA: hypothetical protein RQJ54_000112 [Vibrio vulnificus]|uniref:hypothetical protein n=1 Tax=Vibrio scophthalmi TaxID=45658 RepID=UPI0028CA75C5|nr:hypothetical protein [Vibrio parahaemolyticus]HDY7522252.1 hypothetical protein [Vibrio vulnificus]